MEDGTVKSFGHNSGGGLGHGEDSLGTDLQEPLREPTTIPGVSNIKQIAVGAEHVLLLNENGSVQVFGSNSDGQLGLGEIEDSELYAPVELTLPSEFASNKVVKVSAGDAHSLLLLDDGSVLSFGSNEYGQLGLGESEGEDLPVKIENISGTIVDVVASIASSFLLMEDGSVFSFGYNFMGQLGTGDFEDRREPYLIVEEGAPLTGVAKIASLVFHTIFLMNDGTAKSFGDNYFGALGHGNTDSYAIPTTINVDGVSLTGIKDISVGYDHSLFLMDDGSVRSFGGSHSWLGLGPLESDVLTLWFLV